MKQLERDAVGLFYLSLHVGSTVEPQAMYTLSLGHRCSVRRTKSVLNKHTHIRYTTYRIKMHYLTALAVGFIPPVNTDSCFSTRDSIRRQAGAGVIGTVALVIITGLPIRVWRYVFVTRFKHTRRESKRRYVTGPV